MGLFKSAAKMAVGAAATRARRAGKHYCPARDERNHRYVKWFNEEHPNTGNVHGPGSHIVYHCKDCGFIKP